MKELIERMQLEGMDVVIVKSWFKEFNACLDKCKALNNDGQLYFNSDSYKEADRLYKNLYGFVLGLSSLYYITTELAFKYIDELIDSFNF